MSIRRFFSLVATKCEPSLVFLFICSGLSFEHRLLLLREEIKVLLRSLACRMPATPQCHLAKRFFVGLHFDDVWNQWMRLCALFIVNSFFSRLPCELPVYCRLRVICILGSHYFAILWNSLLVFFISTERWIPRFSQIILFRNLKMYFYIFCKNNFH